MKSVDHRKVRRKGFANYIRAAIACNVLRAAGALASLAYGRARGATLRRDLINIAARTARSGRGHITLHLPDGWHREHQWLTLFAATAADLFTPDTAAPFTTKARRIAGSLELALFHRLGAPPDGLPPRTSQTPGTAPCA